jgi:hypothetical protein
MNIPGDRVASRAKHAVQACIHRYHLEDPHRWPVDIFRVAEAEGWEVLAGGDLAPMMGWATTCGTFRRMRLNTRVPWPWQRFTVAHELAHALHGDLVSLTEADGSLMVATALTATRGRLLRDQEMAASLTAARLLIPDALLDQTLGQGVTLEEIARRAVVPLPLVQLRLGMISATDFLRAMRAAVFAAPAS